MPGIGRRCHELRIVDQDETWRVFYHESQEAIVVLDVFAKKTARTPRSIIDQCRRRLSEFQRIVKKRGNENMNSKQRRNLEKAGWAIGDTGDFLELTPEERSLVETKLALAAGFRSRREELKLTQVEAAGRLGSSQSRVAKIEAADSTVSVDLMMRALFGLGVSREDVARILAAKPRRDVA